MRRTGVGSRAKSTPPNQSFDGFTPTTFRGSHAHGCEHRVRVVFDKATAFCRMTVITSTFWGASCGSESSGSGADESLRSSRVETSPTDAKN
jgi:hypothetical protein